MTADPASAGAVAPPADPTLADLPRLRGAFAAFPTGVTVVTVGGGTPHGMTANAFTSLSLNPPLALVCVNRDARMHRLLPPASGFGISVLAANQADVARWFSNRERPAGAAQFAEVAWSPGHRTGAPLIEGALAWFECTLWGSHDGGDHTIFVGRVVSVVRQEGGGPLLFHNGSFLSIRPKE